MAVTPAVQRLDIDDHGHVDAGLGNRQRGRAQGLRHRIIELDPGSALDAWASANGWAGSLAVSRAASTGPALEVIVGVLARTGFGHLVGDHRDVAIKVLLNGLGPRTFVAIGDVLERARVVGRRGQRCGNGLPTGDARHRPDQLLHRFQRLNGSIARMAEARRGHDPRAAAGVARR